MSGLGFGQIWTMDDLAVRTGPQVLLRVGYDPEIVSGSRLSLRGEDRAGVGEGGVAGVEVDPSGLARG